MYDFLSQDICNVVMLSCDQMSRYKMKVYTVYENINREIML